MLKEFVINTNREQLHKITPQVEQAVEQSGVEDGICVVFSPHTTAGITVNENADPDVARDILFALDKAYPEHEEYRHYEGNSAAHLKTSAVGVSLTLIVENGKLLLGTWQGVYLCEFDGPRTRHFFVKVIEG